MALSWFSTALSCASDEGQQEAVDHGGSELLPADEMQDPHPKCRPRRRRQFYVRHARHAALNGLGGGSAIGWLTMSR
jgi:hypothetical protein